MDFELILAGSGAGLAIASAAYGIWQAKRASMANEKAAQERAGCVMMQNAKDRLAETLEKEREKLAKVSCHLDAANSTILDLTRSLQAAEQHRAKTERSLITTKGNCTKLRKQLASAQGKAAA